MTYSDLYGPANVRTGQPAASGQTTGKQTSAVAGLAGEGSAPAMFWVGLIVLLIALRVLIEYNG
jgi:hypothetical protein